MDNSLVSPRGTYERLCNEARDARRKRSLDALNEVCRLLHERGSSDFSYRTVITLGKDRGLPVPGEKSIVNSTGIHYRELIQSWKLISVTGRTSEKSHPNDWIESIEDPALRLSVALLAKELRTIKARIIRQEKTSSAPIYLGTGIIQEQSASQQIKLNEIDLYALKAAIDPAVLAPLGFSIGNRGEVVDGKGRTIHKPGFRDAIEKILSVQNAKSHFS